MKTKTRPDTPRAIGVALAFFGSLALVAWGEGVFARLEGEVVMAIAVFALAFAAATCVLDAEVRDYLKGALRLRKAPARSPAGKRAAT